MPIEYRTGDATKPQGEGPKVIAHVVNTAGGWGKGFVLAVSKCWPEPEKYYRAWHSGDMLQNPTKGKVLITTDKFKLGEVQFVQVLPDTFVVNMVAQAGYKTGRGGPPIRYGALATCLQKAFYHADMLYPGWFQTKASLHMPRIGCGLAGGEWSKVEPLILAAQAESAHGVNVTVYDAPGSHFNP